MFLLGLLLIALLGYLGVNLIFNKKSFLFKFSVGYVTGMGIFTLTVFVLNLAGFAYSLTNMLLVVLVFIVTPTSLSIKKGIKIDIKKDVAKSKKNLNKLSGLEKSILITTLFFVATSLLIDVYWPVKDWDSLVLYDFRAKLFEDTGFMQTAIQKGYFFSYPLLTSLGHTWQYFLGASTPNLMYLIYFVSLIIIFYSVLQDTGNTRTTALIAAFLLIISPRIYEHAHWAYTNLPYVVYLFSGVIFFYAFLRDRNKSYFYLSLVSTGLSGWVRFAEPFWLITSMLAFIFLILEKNYKLAVVYPLGVWLFRQPWALFVKEFAGRNLTGETTNLITESFSGKVFELQNLLAVIEYFWTHVITEYWYIFLLLTITFFVFIRLSEKKLEDWFITLFNLVSIAAIIYGVYAFSLTQPYWQEIGDSASRMSMFLVPSVLLYFFSMTKYIKR